VISDPLAVFVAPAPAGNDSNAGTKEHPVATLGKGIELAESGGTKRVIACGATFTESLSLSAPGDDVGLQVFGGVACPSDPAPWTYTGTKAIVVSAGAGPALHVSGLTKPVLFQDVELEAASMDGGAPPGNSSFGAVVTGTTSATFTNVTFVAKDATNGADGTTPKSNHATESLNGVNAGADGGAGPGPSSTCPCPDGTSSTGGQGGSSAVSPGPGLPPEDGGGAAGQNGIACGTAGEQTYGGPGADAPPKPADGTGASTSGIFGDAGWVPTTGNPGSNGPPGQGGGGGGDGVGGTGAGGGGACGGCGGAGGPAGGGGGSSIALLLVQSGVTLTKCTFVAGAAGNGGKGAPGEGGQAGSEIGGFPSSTTGGCQGGTGGAGAGGNGGGGGAGGLAAGVAYVGTPPTIDGSPVPSATTLPNVTIPDAGGAPGVKGTGGPAASSLAGKPGNDGAPGAAGVSQAVVVIP
jgi:hypothetical protein